MEIVYTGCLKLSSIMQTYKTNQGKTTIHMSYKTLSQTVLFAFIIVPLSILFWAKKTSCYVQIDSKHLKRLLNLAISKMFGSLYVLLKEILGFQKLKNIWVAQVLTLYILCKINIYF